MEKYTDKIFVPQYEPHPENLKGKKAVNTKKYDELIKEINESSLGERQKNFLRLAATRHIQFDYSVIADYYAVADEEMQRLMEKSALVIIDFDNAIANGYLNLSKKVEDIIKGRTENKQ